MTGIDRIDTAPHLFPFAQGYGITPAGPGPVTVAAPQFNVTLTIQGNADERTTNMMRTELEDFWSARMRDAGITTNAKRGKLP